MGTKVCILLPSHWSALKGGAEYQAHCLADYLSRNSDLHVTYLTRNAPSDVDGYGYEIKQFQGPPCFRKLRWGYSPDSVALYQSLVEMRPDVIIQTVASAHTGIAVYYARKHSKRMIWYIASDMDIEESPNLGVSGPAELLDGALFRYGIKNCDDILAQTTKQSDRMQQTLGRKPLALVPNFHPTPSGKMKKSGKFTVIWVANFKPLKQPELFIALARALSDEDIEFRMIGRLGQSKWARGIKKQINSLDNLVYLGELAIDEVNQEISKSHLFVNTSEYEGFPNTFIQAWMREVPTVSINVDPDNVIQINGLGQLTGNLQGLVDTVREYKHNLLELSAAATRARDFATLNYSMKNAAQILELLQRDVLGAEGP